MSSRIVLMTAFLLPLVAIGCSAAPSGWKTYQSQSFPFSISYPADYVLNDHFTYDALGPGKDIHGVSVTIPERLAQGTNLSSDTRLSVEVLPNARVCTPNLFLDNVTETRVEREGDLSFNVAESGDAGAGNFYEETVFAVSNSATCVAVRYFIHSHNIGNYDPGSVKAFDRAALVRAFDDIRKTLVVASAR